MGKGACVDQCTYYGCNLFDVLENVWRRRMRTCKRTKSRNTFSSFFKQRNISNNISQEWKFSLSFSYEKQLKANDSLTIFFLDLSNTHATGQSFSNEFFLPFSTPTGWNNLEGRVSRYSRRSIDDKIEPSKAGHFSPPHNSNYIGRNDRVRPGPEPEGTLHDCPEAVEDCASLAIFVHPAENCSSSF